jgi:hypothetical protein
MCYRSGMIMCEKKITSSFYYLPADTLTYRISVLEKLMMKILCFYSFSLSFKTFCWHYILKNIYKENNNIVQWISFLLSHSILLSYTLKRKTRKKNKFRSSTVMVLKMFFFWNRKCYIFEKKVLVTGTNHGLSLEK